MVYRQEEKVPLHAGQKAGHYFGAPQSSSGTPRHGARVGDTDSRWEPSLVSGRTPRPRTGTPTLPLLASFPACPDIITTSRQAVLKGTHRGGGWWRLDWLDL